MKESPVIPAIGIFNDVGRICAGEIYQDMNEIIANYRETRKVDDYSEGDCG